MQSPIAQSKRAADVIVITYFPPDLRHKQNHRHTHTKKNTFPTSQGQEDKLELALKRHYLKAIKNV